MSKDDRFVRFAKKAAPFVVAQATDHLPKARVLDVSAPMALADDGPGSTLTLGVQGANSSARGVVRLVGQLGGSADAPDVRGVRIPSGDTGEGPQLLALGNVKDGEALVRAGGAVVGAALLRSAGGTLTGPIDLGGHKITHLAVGVDAEDAATFGQLTSMLNGLDWQAAVVRDDLNAVPTSPAPTTGDRFLVAPGASGSPWGTHSGRA